MEVKGAIEFFSNVNWDSTLDKFTPIEITKNLHEIFEQLRQGEADSKELKIVKEELKKVWQMWEELEHALTDSEDYNEFSWSPKAREIMKGIEIKHFPEEMKSNGQ